MKALKTGIQTVLIIVILLFILFAGLFAYLFLGVGQPSASWKQKLTVQVETGSAMAEGSAVSQIDIKPAGRITGDGRNSNSSLKGEAVVVDLGTRSVGPRYLFALLAELKKPEKGEKVALPRQYYPMLVTFDDIADPKTVKRVDPDDMDAALGLCPDGTGLKDADAPWRAEKLTWRQWHWQQSHIEAARRASEELGFDAQQAEAITTNMLIQRSKGPNSRYEPFGRFKEIGETMTRERRDALRAQYDTSREQEWSRARWRIFDDLFAMPRDTSGDCHRLTGMTLEITDETVTDGKVEAVLGWWCEYRAKYLVDRYADSVPNEFAREIGGSHFRTGECS